MQRRWKWATGGVMAAAAVGAYLYWFQDWRPSCSDVPSAAEAARWLNAITKEGDAFKAEYVACVEFIAIHVGPDPRGEMRDHYPHSGIGVFPESRPPAEDFAKLVGLPRLNHLSVWLRDSPAGYADALAGSIGRIKTLKRMRWWASGLTDAGARQFGNLTEIVSIEFNDATLGDGVEAWSKLPKLSEVRLWSTTLGADGVARLGDLRTVAELGIYSSRLTGSLAPVARMPALRVLTLSRGEIGEEQIASIAGAPELRYLAVTANKLGARAFAGIAKLPQLVGLNLQGSEIAGGLELLSAAPKLESVSLMGAKLDDAAGAGLGALRGVKSLWFSESKVGDRTASALAASPALEYLDLGETAVTDEGVRALAKAPKLRILHLYKTAVTDAGIALLAQYPSLREVSLQETKGTAAGVAALKAAKPDLVVHFK